MDGSGDRANSTSTENYLTASSGGSVFGQQSVRRNSVATVVESVLATTPSDCSTNGSASAKGKYAEPYAKRKEGWSQKMSSYSSFESYKAKMHSDLKSGSLVKRLYFEYGTDVYGDVVYHGASGLYSDPALVDDEESLIFTIEDSLEKGCPYYAVICLLLDARSMNISAIRMFDMDLNLDEIRSDESQQFARILLRGQFVRREEYYEIEVLCSDKSMSASVQLCYIELSQEAPQPGSYDCILPSSPLPRKSIGVWHFEDDHPLVQQVPAYIKGYAISAIGSHVATLSSTGVKLHLDLWDLDLTTSGPRVSYPFSPSIPMATASVTCVKEDHQNICVTLSWDGSQIVVHGSDHATNPLFRLFTHYCTRETHRQHLRNRHPPVSLNPSTRCIQHTAFRSFKGCAKFTSTSTSYDGGGSERFIFCIGMDLYVFSTTGEWDMLHCISVLPESSPSDSGNMILTAARGVLVSQASPFQLYIWNIELGKCIHTIDVTRSIVKFYLSSDGSTVTVITTSQILFYSIESGELLQSSSGSYQHTCGYLEGNSGIVQRSHSQGDNRLLILDSSSLRCRKEVHLPSHEHWSVTDIETRVGSQDSSSQQTIIVCQHGSILEMSLLDDISSRIDGKPLCTPECKTELRPIPEVRAEETIIIPGGMYMIRKNGSSDIIGSRTTIDMIFENSRPRRLQLETHKTFITQEHSMVIGVSRSVYGDQCSIWKLPQSPDEECELVLHWLLPSATGEYLIESCPHEKRLVLNRNTERVHLSIDRVCAPENASFFFDAVGRLQVYMKNPGSEASRGAIRYIRSHLNKYPCPEDRLRSVISQICTFWYHEEHEQHKEVLQEILQPQAENNWIPLARYTENSNPISIILEKSRKHPEAIEIAALIIDYCVQQVRSEQDVAYVMFFLECMDGLTARYPELACRASQAFAYVRCHTQSFLDNRKISYPPIPRQIWNPGNPKVCATGATLDSLDREFSEEIFVAPVNLLWSFIPNDKQPYCTEFPTKEPESLTTSARTLFHIIRYSLTSFSHVYVRSRFYSLEILDNPAVEAVVDYKWNAFVYRYWLAQFGFQCIFYFLILMTTFMQIYYPQKEIMQWRKDRSQALLQFADMDNEGDSTDTDASLERNAGETHVALQVDQTNNGTRLSLDSQQEKGENTLASKLSSKELKNKTEGKAEAAFRKRSSYFSCTLTSDEMLPYLTLALYPLGVSIMQIAGLFLPREFRLLLDEFSYCVVLVFFHLLSELQVIESVCKYITIIFDALSEVKVIFVMLLGSVLTFSVAILHSLYGVIPLTAEERLQVHMPDNFFGAFVSVYLILGGRYDPITKDLYEDGNGNEESRFYNLSTHLILMFYFSFASVLLLNVIISVVGAAVSKANGTWRQVWLENRIRFIENAENMSYHIPGFRETFEWFPRHVYYTAMPYQVKQYWKHMNDLEGEVRGSFQSTNTRVKEPTSGINSLEPTLDKKYTHQSHSCSEDLKEIKEILRQQNGSHMQHLSSVMGRIGQQDEGIRERLGQDSKEHGEEMSILRSE
ncbi:hypothetical protein BGW38_004611 [Lunasporangiospora selenospora]|uniref:Ion transport domain-containing protein n=1 Tax=Lunasporangiospora selenospora TaxID=979761 RepID=A0A9P6KHM3_9FUNG|nr:hypothetical protein BGW38_004611 [Lunasporangiospora selenospora]